MWVSRATFDGECIRVEVTDFMPEMGWINHTEWFYTTPEGGWTELVFDETSSTTYVDFLNAMVVKTLEVNRKIALVSLDMALETKRYSRIVELLDILDPTFEMPVINRRAKWQRDLMKHIANVTSYRVVSTCYNEANLMRYATSLRLL